MKKGSVVYHFTVVMTWIAFLWFLIMVVSSQSKILASGEAQIKTIESYYEGEKILFYIDNAVRNSITSSFFILGNQGGFKKESECGSYRGSQLWNNLGKECYPNGELLRKDFKETFADHLIYYASFYDNAKFTTRPSQIIIDEDDSSIIVRNKENIADLDVDITIDKDVAGIEVKKKVVPIIQDPDDPTITPPVTPPVTPPGPVGAAWTFWPIDTQTSHFFYPTNIP